MIRALAAIALLVPATARADVFPLPPSVKLRLEVEVTAQARGIVRDGDDLSDLRLDRGEVGAWIGLGAQAGAELRFESVRSALEGGALGVDGDSTVARVKFAQVWGHQRLGPVVLEGAAGYVPDPWIRALEEAYPLKALSRTGSERLLGWPTSDLALFARATLGPARLGVHVGNGEGIRFPERNNGKTTTAVLEVAALDTDVVRLVAAAVGRDGSIGPASSRERRAGGALSVATPWVRAGGEVLRAWGIGDRGESEGWLVEGWAEGAIPGAPLFVSARGATLGFDSDGRQTTFGGAIAVEPWREAGGLDHPERARGRLRVWLAIDRVTTAGTAMPFPGADAGDATVLMLVASALAPTTFP